PVTASLAAPNDRRTSRNRSHSITPRPWAAVVILDTMITPCAGMPAVTPGTRRAAFKPALGWVAQTPMFGSAARLSRHEEEPQTWKTSSALRVLPVMRARRLGG